MLRQRSRIGKARKNRGRQRSPTHHVRRWRGARSRTSKFGPRNQTAFWMDEAFANAAEGFRRVDEGDRAVDETFGTSLAPSRFQAAQMGHGAHAHGAVLTRLRRVERAWRIPQSTPGPSWGRALRSALPLLAHPGPQRYRAFGANVSRLSPHSGSPPTRTLRATYRDFCSSLVVWLSDISAVRPS